MKTVRVTKKFLEEILDYMEHTEQSIECTQPRRCRDIELLIIQHEMPDIYYKTKEMLELLK